MRLSFDLLESPWIPLRLQSGRVVEESVRWTFKNASQVLEIRSESPLATAALMRLILAITYRACGSVDEDEWAAWWNASELPLERILAYLDGPLCRDRFDLFSEQRPFYQASGLEIGQEKMPARRSDNQTPIFEPNFAGVAKLATELPTANNRVLFEWDSFSRMQACGPAEAARRLVEIQTFALGGGVASTARFADVALSRPNFQDGHAARDAHVWLAGDNLTQTLLLNLIPDEADEADIPAWEYDHPVDSLDSYDRGIIALLTWQSRLIRLLPQVGESGEIVVQNMYFTQGRPTKDEAAFAPDLLAVHVEAGQPKRILPLRLSKGKSSWRDLHSITSMDDRLRPRILYHAALRVEDGLLPSHALYNLHVVGQVADQAAVALYRHDSMSIPGPLLTDVDTVAALATGIGVAENVGRALRARIRDLARRFLVSSDDQRSGRKKEIDNLAELLDMSPEYWARLETRFAMFLQGLTEDLNEALESWKRSVIFEGHCAFVDATRKLGDSTRSIQAAAGVSDDFANAAQGRSERGARHRKRRNDA